MNMFSSFLLGRLHKSRIVGPYDKAMCLRNCKSAPKQLHHVMFTSNVRVALSPYLVNTCYYVFIIATGRYKVVSHVFDLHFPSDF